MTPAQAYPTLIGYGSPSLRDHVTAALQRGTPTGSSNSRRSALVFNRHGIARLAVTALAALLLLVLVVVAPPPAHVKRGPAS